MISSRLPTALGTFWSGGVALVVVLLLCASTQTVDAFSLNFSVPVEVAIGATQKHMWHPRRGVQLNNDTIAIQLMTSPKTCHDDSQNPCTYVVAYTVNGGANFSVLDDPLAVHFCGERGAEAILEDNSTTLTCPVTDKVHTRTTTSLKLHTVTFKFPSAAAAEEGAVATVSEGADFVSYTFEENIPEDASIALGEGVATSLDQSHKVSNIIINHHEHVAFTSSDDGVTWQRRGSILKTEAPADDGDDKKKAASNRTQSIVMWGEDQFMFVIPGSVQSLSNKDKGASWGKTEAASFRLPMRSAVLPYRTLVYSGTRGEPGLWLLALGQAKGSERPVNLALHHNVNLKKSNGTLSRFDEKFVAASKFENCDGPNPTPEQGCQSSSHVEMVQVAPSRFMVFYDMVGEGGFGDVSAESPDRVFSMLFDVDEKKEKDAHDRHKAKLEYEKKVEEETQRRLKEQRRQKRKREKERREQWEKNDAPNIAIAKEQQKEDNELVVVRNVDEKWADVEAEYL
eukprot:PhM_4_TR10401/c0_g1_i1/m.21569